MITHMGNLESPIKARLRIEGGSWSTWRELAQTWGEQTVNWHWIYFYLPSM